MGGMGGGGSKLSPFSLKNLFITAAVLLLFLGVR
jgi:hypothetical protein